MEKIIIRCKCVVFFLHGGFSEVSVGKGQKVKWDALPPFLHLSSPSSSFPSSYCAGSALVPPPLSVAICLGAARLLEPLCHSPPVLEVHFWKWCCEDAKHPGKVGQPQTMINMALSDLLEGNRGIIAVELLWLPKGRGQSVCVMRKRCHNSLNHHKRMFFLIKMFSENTLFTTLDCTVHETYTLCIRRKCWDSVTLMKAASWFPCRSLQGWAGIFAPSFPSYRVINDKRMSALFSLTFSFLKRRGECDGKQMLFFFFLEVGRRVLSGNVGVCLCINGN